MLHSLISTEGRSLGEILRYQEWNQQISSTHQKYLKAIELLDEEKTFKDTANLHDLLKGKEFIRTSIVEDTLEEAIIEPITTVVYSVIKDENVINYSEEYDINMNDLLNYESNNIGVNNLFFCRL